MRDIVKGREPVTLVRHRNDAAVAPTYENLPGRAMEALRRQLLADQGALCCYCTRRITLDTSRIEHWAPRAKHPTRALDGRNLLLACDGHAADGPDAHTCDVLKDDSELSLDPLDGVEHRLRYDAEGRILADTDHRQSELDRVLGLNRPHVVRRRRAALDGMMEALAKRRTGAWPRRLIEDKLGWCRAKVRDEFPAFAPLLVYWLERRLDRQR